GERPVVVLSRDSINAHSPVVIVVPATDADNVKRPYPMHVHLARGQGGLKMNSIVKTEQIRAIQTSRFQEYYGRIDSQAIKRIEERERRQIVRTVRGRPWQRGPGLRSPVPYREWLWQCRKLEKSATVRPRLPA